MTFKPSLWYPLSTVLSVLNVGAIAFAAAAAEPLHAAAHGVLAVAFGLWALRLREAREEPQRVINNDPRLEVLEGEVNELRRELSEAQEALDFTERLLAQRPEVDRVNAPREPRDL